MKPIYSYASEREANLLRLWNMNQDVVQRALRKYKWIPAQDYDDYRQEMFLHVWNVFHRWMERRHSGLQFEQWLFMECRAAAFAYRRRELQIGSRLEPSLLFAERVKQMDDMSNFFSIKTDEYSEAALQGLSRAVDSLGAEDRAVVQMFLEEVDFRAESVKACKQMAYYSSQLSQIKAKIRSTYKRYFEDMRVLIKPNPNMARGLGGEHPQAKPVLQLSLCGDIIRRWPSAVDAQNEGGFNRKNISTVIKGEKGSHRGFKWALESEYNRRSN